MGIELPAELAPVAAAAGVRWPQADEEAMRSSAQAWRTAGTKITSLAKDADGTANQALSAVQGDTGTAAKQHWHTFVAPDTGHLTSAARGCTDAADRLDHAADQVGAAKVQIVKHLVNLAQQQDAANQAAAAGHPMALAGLTTTVTGTATSVAQVNHSLTNTIRLDNTPTGQTSPAGPGDHGLLGSSGPFGGGGPLGSNGPLGDHGPLGSNGPLGGGGQSGSSGPLADHGLLGSNGPLGDHGLLGSSGPLGGGGPLGSNGPLNVVQPVVAPVTHGVDQAINPVTQPVDNTVGSLTGGPGGGHGLGLDPGHTGPVAGTIGAVTNGPGPVLDNGPGPVVGSGPGPVGPGPVLGGDHGPTGPGPILPGPVGPDPVQVGVAGADPVQGGPGPIATDPGHGNEPAPPLGVTVAQSAAPPMAPPTDISQGPAPMQPAHLDPSAAAPAAPPPPAAGFTAPPPSFAATPPPAASTIAPVNQPAPNAPAQNQNWAGRSGGGSGDVIGAPVAVPRSNPAGVRQGQRSTVLPPNQDDGVGVLADFGGNRPKPTPRGDAVALFLVYLFPRGQRPAATGRPARQLPPPAPETDFAAGLRFEPHDHPMSDLIDVTAALDHEPEVPTHPGFAAEDPEVAELAAGHDPLGGEHERDWDRRFLVRPSDPDTKRAAEYAWPPGELFPEGGCAAGEPAVLAVDTVIDRFGTPEGRVFSQAGTPFARRSLPPDHLAAGYHRYRVMRELPMWRTLSAAWFGQSGGGVRYRAVYPAADLVALGYLTDITGTDNGH